LNNQFVTKKSITVLLTLVILLSIFAPVMAREDRAAQGGYLPAVPAQVQGPTDPTELEAFLDKFMASNMAEYHIAGAAVSVVKDGEVLLSKGYGYANLEKGIPIDPETTGFRVGSVTKLFTWTAVMQLAEQGKLDLDADINKYLDFRIPDTYPQPITLKHLLSHTDGFEERFFEFNVLDADELVPEREWLASHMPARVRPPGDVAAYSNYGTSLAGYIVARVSGQPYYQYIQEHILAPLGMTHSSVKMPLLPELKAQGTVGYTFVDGSFQPFQDYMSQWATAPAAAMQTSAADMARFMIAHLPAGGNSDAGKAIMSEDTLRQMHSTLFNHDPRLLGTAYGFFEFTDNGQRAIGHDGEAHPVNSQLLLLPDQNLGIFLSYNSEGGGELTSQHLGFQRSFFDHYYPAPAVEPIQPPADFAERAGKFAGSYILTRSSYTTLEKVKDLMGGTVDIRDSGDGALIFGTPWGEWRFIEVAPLYFRQEDAPYAITFREDSRGRITYLFTDYTPQFAFEKLSWYETPGFHMALVAGCILIFLSVIPVMVILAIRRRLSGDRETATGNTREAQWIMLGVCILNLLFVVGTVLWGEPNIIPLLGVTLIYKIVLGLGVLAAILTAGALVYTVLAWKNKYWNFTGRAYYSLVTIAAVGFVWFLNFWNLLGWRF